MILSFARKAKNSPPISTAWLDIESESYLFKLKKMEAGDGRHALMDDEWVHKGDKMQYLSVVYFTPHGSSTEHPALAGFIYDPDYYGEHLLPPGAERSDAG